MSTNSRMIVLFCALASVVGVQANVLMADAILKVKGADRELARVIVQPEFGEAFDIETKDAHFPLEFGLQASYLLRAEHENCPAKEIIFDCRLPIAYESETFEFPLEIVLEAYRKNEKPWNYAHPVGLVYFDEAKHEFVYSTDYSREKHPEVIDRLRSLIMAPRPITMEPPLSDMRTVSAPILEGVSELRATSTPVSAEAEAPASATPELAPELDVPEVMEAKDTAHLVVHPPVVPVSASTSVPSAVETAPITTPVAARRTTERSSVRSEKVEHGIIGTQPPSIPEACGTHDEEHLQNCLVFIDRVPTPDGCVELRKAVHAYGAVFYFHDGRAVTQYIYEQTLHAQVQATLH